MSNLLANGHIHAHDYPVWQVWIESQLVVERTNSLIVTNAVVFQAAMATTAMTTKQGLQKASDHFAKILKGLSNES